MDAIEMVAALQPVSGDLGPYELIRMLDSNDVATLFLARHRDEHGLVRLRAIEVLHPHLATDQQLLSAWLDGARAAARLSHPNVIPTLEVGSHGGLHFVVLEYVEGVTLSTLLPSLGEQRPPSLLVSILLDVLAGLHAAHTLSDDDGTPLGLVHRDISPHNVLVGSDGTARLMRLGSGRAQSRCMSARPGQLGEAIAFLSPEQIRGADKIDRRSDVFSSAAMLWSMLTGRALFLADSDAATFNNILHLRVPPASTIGCKPPAELDAVLERGLARNPAARFQSARELEEALREAAGRASCIGTPAEVAPVVAAGFGDELAERRAVEAATNEALVAPADSGTESVATAMDPPRRRARVRTGLLLGCGAASLLVLFSLVALENPMAADARANAAEQPAATSPAVQRSKPPAPAAPRPPAPASSSKLVEPVAPSASAGQQSARARAPSRRAADPAKPRAESSPAPVPAAPATAAAPTQPERWNMDSPLPPQ